MSIERPTNLLPSSASFWASSLFGLLFPFDSAFEDEEEEEEEDIPSEDAALPTLLRADDDRESSSFNLSRLSAAEFLSLLDAKASSGVPSAEEEFVDGPIGVEESLTLVEEVKESLVPVEERVFSTNGLRAKPDPTIRPMI